jgi:gliding motility-associated-like protein
VDNSSPVTITGLTNGTTYLVKIRGVNTAGQGAASSAISVITGISLSNQSITIDPIANQTYTGSALTPAMVVKDGTTKLTLSTDYTVAYTNNTNVGTATATITGAGNYIGTKTQTFVIVARPIVPSGLSYSPATQTVRQGVAISPLIPTISGDTPGYTISPALAAGLSINATSGIISGTLTAAQTGTVRYTVTASNTEGSTTSTVTLVFNTAPTGISVAPSAVAENAASGTTIGTLSATDTDAGDTFTYELVSGAGSTDNALFTIDGANLKATTAFDFETKSSYTVRVRTTDAGGLSFEKAITITVINVNDAPIDLALSTTPINENNAANAVIGALTSTDQDAGDTHTYALVSGTGSTDNALFSIDGANLRTGGVFDFETKSSYSVRVRTTDAGGLSFEQAITVTVINVNDAPTDLALSAVYIYENNAIGATIGELSSKDQDAGDKHTYTLVSGDVSSFKVSGNQLVANVVYVHGTKNSYEIVVKSTDAGGLSVNKAIRITILQSPEVIGRANLAQNKQSSVVGQSITISKGYSANLVLIASNIVKYTWSPATGLSSTNISNPIASPTQTTTYTVRVTNTQGISTDVFVTVTVLEDYNITPNNVLSPDGDGVNDFWTIENLSSYPNNEVKIFDKAGRIIFNEKNYQNTWNGQLNGTTLHEGTYYYVINLGPGTRPKTGYITLFSNK